MGTGSFGGGGGGGGGAAGTLASGTGGVRFDSDSKVQPAGVSSSQAYADVSKVLRSLKRNNSRYLSEQFANPFLAHVFEQLFRLSVAAFQDHSWRLIERDYGIAGKSGCLVAWVNKIVADGNSQKTDPKMIATARLTLEDFLLMALDDDSDLYLEGTGDDIVAKLSQKVFNSTSGFFLGALVWRVIERDHEVVRVEARTTFRHATQQHADRVINRFQQKYMGDGRTTFRDLFRVIQSDTNWLLTELAA